MLPYSLRNVTISIHDFVKIYSYRESIVVHFFVTQQIKVINLVNLEFYPPTWAWFAEKSMHIYIILHK